MNKILFKENISGFIGSGKDIICVQKNYPSSMKIVSYCFHKLYDWSLDEYTVAIFKTKKLKNESQ
jgi:hypothetical protein